MPGKYGEPGGEGAGGGFHNTKTHKTGAGTDAIHKTLTRLPPHPEQWMREAETKCQIKTPI